MRDANAQQSIVEEKLWQSIERRFFTCSGNIKKWILIGGAQGSCHRCWDTGGSYQSRGSVSTGGEEHSSGEGEDEQRLATGTIENTWNCF